MKHLMSVLALAAIFAVPAAQATTHKEAPEMTKQQTKMGTCNKEAGDKKGDERKAFMKTCLSAQADAQKAQQNKMKTCNVDAKGKKGDERKSFMSECLKKAA